MVFQHLLLLSCAACLVGIPISTQNWNGYILQNQQGEYVLSKAPSATGFSKSPSRAYILGMKIEFQYATLEDLCDLPGIGKNIAQDLLEARERGNTTWDIIDAIPGIGEGRLNTLQKYLSLPSPR